MGQKQWYALSFASRIASDWDLSDLFRNCCLRIELILYVYICIIHMICMHVWINLHGMLGNKWQLQLIILDALSCHNYLIWHQCIAMCIWMHTCIHICRCMSYLNVILWSAFLQNVYPHNHVEFSGLSNVTCLVFLVAEMLLILMPEESIMKGSSI